MIEACWTISVFFFGRKDRVLEDLVRIGLAMRLDTSA